MDRRIDKNFFMRVYLVDVNSVESELGIIAYDSIGVYYTTDYFASGKFWTKKESAIKVLNDIVTEKPATMSDGKVYPPNMIHRIGGMNNNRKRIDFRISIIELDVERISMQEVGFVVGHVSFNNPEIQITSRSL